MNQQGYQPAATTVVVVPSRGMRGPDFMRQGVRVGGMALGLSCVICLGLFGGFFLFSSVIMLATANYDDDFWDDFDRSTDPIVIVGSIFLVIGLLLVGACVVLCVYARKKYKTINGPGTTNPGRVIREPPAGYAGQPPPAGYSGQPAPTGYPGQPYPSSYPGQSQPAGYPGHPQPAGYPDQPQPAGYSGQPPSAGYPDQQLLGGYPGQPLAPLGQPAGYPGPPASYPDQPVGYPGHQDQSTSYPVKSEQMTMNHENAPPLGQASAPEPTAPFAPSSDPPPYQP